jgi:hypothetical protein
MRISFLIAKGGKDVACASVKEIEDVTVTLHAADGRTVIAGFPKIADCSSGVLETSVAPGNYALEVVAEGHVGSEKGVLFTAHTMTTPDMKDVQLSLKPEVAYLTIVWSFENQDLMPCLSNDVDHVQVTISTGSTHASFDRAFPCMATPVAIDEPFPLDSFTILIQAFSDQGAPLFSRTVMRTPERGDQEVDLVLTPLGGSLFLDWQFGIRAELTRACNDPRVDVATIAATVVSLEGGQPISDHFDCAVGRPYRFRAARFRPGRSLELDLVGESVIGGEPMRFKGVDVFTMPDGDKTWMPPLTMYAVGTATVAIRIATSTCSTQIFDGFEVKVTTADSGTPPRRVFDQRLDHGVSSVAVEDLPYGAYLIEVSQILNQTPLCRAEKTRTIDARYNMWDPFVL